MRMAKDFENDSALYKGTRTRGLSSHDGERNGISFFKRKLSIPKDA